MNSPKTVTLEDLKFVPRLFGEPLYLGGFPAKPDQTHFEGKSATQLWIESTERKLDEDQERFVKDFMIYFLHAPIFDNELTREIKEKVRLEMTINELTYLLMDCALDPF